PPVALSRHLSHLSSESFRPHPASPLFPYTTLFRSFRAGILDCGPDRRRYPFGVLVLPEPEDAPSCVGERACGPEIAFSVRNDLQDRKSTRLNSSHVSISYAVFCLKKNIYYKFRRFL